MNIYKANKLKRFVIDEVHCVSHWGQDFREDYLKLSVLRERYPGVPILGLTATATQQVKADISRLLCLKNALYFQSSFNRPNLFYEIVKKNKNKLTDHIAEMIKENYINKSGIIYCLTKKECEKMCAELKSKFKIKCEYFHAGLPHNKRKEIQRKWMKDECYVIIATVAFGMGINKKDVRFVFHTAFPKSIEAYSQE